jgi:hypothetical protein
MTKKSYDQRQALEPQIDPGAWERFERAVDTVSKSGPQHRTSRHVGIAVVALSRFGTSLSIAGELVAFDKETGEVRSVRSQAEWDLLLHGSPEQCLSQFLKLFDLNAEAQS